jgi:two-component system phosphate regulon sensor histidine kinase PhoR
VLADSQSDPHTMENHGGRPEVRAALATGEGQSVRHSKTLGVDMMYVAVPLRVNGEPYAVVRTAVPMTAVNHALSALNQRIALAALLAAGAAWAVSRRTGLGRSKVLARLAPMALAAALIALGLRAGGLSGLLAALCAAATVAAAAAIYRRRGPDRAACAGCPEAPASSACSGFRAIALRERAFARLAGRWIDRAT